MRTITDVLVCHYAILWYRTDSCCKNHSFSHGIIIQHNTGFELCLGSCQPEVDIQSLLLWVNGSALGAAVLIMMLLVVMVILYSHQTGEISDN